MILRGKRASSQKPALAHKSRSELIGLIHSLSRSSSCSNPRNRGEILSEQSSAARHPDSKFAITTVAENSIAVPASG
jgi:hypothetical protein